MCWPSSLEKEPWLHSPRGGSPQPEQEGMSRWCRTEGGCVFCLPLIPYLKIFFN